MIKEDNYWHHVNHCDKRPSEMPFFGQPYFEEGCNVIKSSLPDEDITFDLQKFSIDQLQSFFV